MKQRWSLHFCPLDREDARLIAPLTMPWRVHLNTPWFHFAVALRPGDRFVRLRSGGGYAADWTDFRKW
jgi:hypothetical protein